MLDAIEDAIQQSNFNPDQFQAQQRALSKELQSNGSGWLVTDFATAGSPLTHAELLLAQDAAELKAKHDQREFPTCPPVLELAKFSFPHDRVHRHLHHVALFGPAR